MATATSTVLAIDPGPVQSAWVLFDPSGGGVVASNIDPNDVLLILIAKGGFVTDHLAIEMIASYGMPVGKDVFETVRWIGIFQHAWGLERTSLVYRKDVKLHLCGSVRAKDGNIRQALLDKVGPKGTKKAPGPTYGCKRDIWAALAVAVTYSETQEV